MKHFDWRAAGAFSVACVAMVGCSRAGAEERRMSEVEPDMMSGQISGCFPEEDMVNIEEADVTHDGIVDRVVTYINFYEEKDRTGQTAQEAMKEREASCVVQVYDGKNPDHCLWEREFGMAHVGNGQLYLVKDRDGKGYLISNSDYMSSGMAGYGFQVFYLDDAGNVMYETERELSFLLDGQNLLRDGKAEFSVEECVAYTRELAKQLEDSALLVYCNVDKEPKIRAFGEECSAGAEEIWDWITPEVTMENLEEVLERFYEEEWSR